MDNTLSKMILKGCPILQWFADEGLSWLLTEKTFFDLCHLNVIKEEFIIGLLVNYTMSNPWFSFDFIKMSVWLPI